MLKEINQKVLDAKDFYESIKYCVDFWGEGQTLQGSTDAIFDIFCERPTISLKEMVERLDQHIKNNYKSKDCISGEDILEFLLKRYLNYLRG